MRGLLPFVLLPFVLVAGLGCKGGGPMAKIEALRDALAGSDEAAVRTATADYPTCKDRDITQLRDASKGAYETECLDGIANGLGSKAGFVATPPDHAGAATAALVLTRDGRGDALSHVDTWLADLKNGKGTGHDALRLAVARRMVEAAPIIGTKIDDDASKRAALKAIVSAVPGACPTYWLIVNGSDSAKVPAELHPDHSACVQRDLARREGPGGTYGAGLTRAVEGALSIWRETERALRLGAPNAAPNAKATIEAKLVVIEAATQKIETVRVDSKSSAAAVNVLADVHAEAGAPFTPPRRGDAGAPLKTAVP